MVEVGRVQQQQLRQMADNYRLTPATLAHKLNAKWIPAPHLLHISLKIAQAINQGKGRIIISLPPRHGKSELITKYTTAWCLEQYPHWKTILATYGADLSTDFGRAVRDIITENEDLLNVRIRKDAAKVGDWLTEDGGGMAAVGVGGACTGRGANVFLIDDYLKDIKEANSKATRDGIYDWFRTVATTRMEPGATMIIIATRWHYDDLIGRIIQNDVNKLWDYIRIPALAEANDPLGRAEGDALFPERYDRESLLQIKQTLGSFFFNAMYQQDPKASEDAMTNSAWLHKLTEYPDVSGLQLARIWDLAATDGDGDWTVGALLGYDHARGLTYILDIVRTQSSPMAVQNKVRQTAIADGLNTKVYIEQEPGASGKALVEHFQTTVLPEFTVGACPASDGKIERAQPLLASAEAGKVFMAPGHWNGALLDEFADFPGGKHDDQMDAISTGYVKLSGKKTLSASWGRSSHKQGSSIIVPSAADIAAAGLHRSGVTFGR